MRRSRRQHLHPQPADLPPACQRFQRRIYRQKIHQSGALFTARQERQAVLLDE